MSVMSARVAMPTPAMSIAISAVRSSPHRRPSAGVARPKAANIAVGIMPNTPTTVDEKPISSLICAASGLNEVTASLSTRADIAIAQNTSSRPRRRLTPEIIG